MISGSAITARGTGLSLGYTAANPVGSKATVTGSNITGGGAGAVVGSLGELTLIDTNVVATNPNGTGLQLGYGSVIASEHDVVHIDRLHVWRIGKIVLGLHMCPWHGDFQGKRQMGTNGGPGQIVIPPRH